MFRPTDANELVAAYKSYLTDRKPTSIVLSRDEIPQTRLTSVKKAMQGGYVLKNAKKQADIVIMASGSEVPLAMEVAKELEKNYDVSVISITRKKSCSMGHASGLQ